MNREFLLKKILKKIKTGKSDSIGITDLNKIDFSANIKYDFLDKGKILLVHDVPIAKEMVQPYSDGYHYKTKKAIDNIFVDYSPIAVSHPDENFRDFSEEEQVKLTIGYMIDGYTKDNKKYADLIFFVDKTPTVIIDNIKEQKSIDVSIGFRVDIDETPGEFEGKHYDKKQVKIDLDHLAVLPNETGRASFPDGVGIGADSEKINEVVKTTEDIKDLKDALTRNAELGSELKDSNKTVKEQKTNMDKLEKEIKDYKEKNKEVIDKAGKYDKEMKRQEDDKAEKIQGLKDEILKHAKARKDDEFKEFVERNDSVENLQFMLDDLNVSLNGLPAKKKDSKPSNEHMADKYMREKFEKANEGSKVI